MKLKTYYRPQDKKHYFYYKGYLAKCPDIFNGLPLLTDIQAVNHEIDLEPCEIDKINKVLASYGSKAHYSKL